MKAVLDHLVVAARSLDEGVAWCEAALGVTPAPGGKHALMGTHNRLLPIASPEFARAYLEIIAIDPEAAAPGRVRWFDLDEAALQASLARGPRLVHWVARTSDIDAAVAALAAQGVDRGRVLQASRATPQGELRWRISVRDDGRRLFAGALPTLIEWGAAHPVDALPASGVTLQSFTLGAGDPSALEGPMHSLGIAANVRGGSVALTFRLRTPRGEITISSWE